MNAKEIDKVQRTVKKEATKSLTGAVKEWCRLFNNKKEVNVILKDNDIKVDKAIVPALVALSKDKEVVISLCKEILPRVDSTFVAYKEVERTYFDSQDQSKNTTLPKDKVEAIVAKGNTHKRFGYNTPVDFDGGVYYEPYNGRDCRIIKCAVPITKYTFSLIAKCVTYYLTHPKQER